MTYINTKGKRRENYLVDTLSNMKTIAQANTNRNTSMLQKKEIEELMEKQQR